MNVSISEVQRDAERYVLVLQLQADALASDSERAFQTPNVRSRAYAKEALEKLE